MQLCRRRADSRSAGHLVRENPDEDSALDPDEPALDPDEPALDPNKPTLAPDEPAGDLGEDPAAAPFMQEKSR